MGDAMSLVELLTRLTGAELLFRREDEDDLLAVAVLALPAGRQVLFVERTYRDGTRVLLNIWLLPIGRTESRPAV
jgi:hypothetical protein